MKDIVFRTIMLKGASGNDITNIEKTSSSGVVDTYTITLSDGSTETFEVTNGSSISAIEKTATSGLVDTYTVTLTDGSTTTFEVTNGEDAQLYEIPTDGVIGYDSNNAVPDGYTEITSPYDAALSSTSDNAPQNKAVKAAIDNINSALEFSPGTEFDITNGIYAGSLANSSKDLYFFIPLPKGLTNIPINKISISGTWYIRANGVNVVAGSALSSVGTVTLTKAAGGIQVKCVLTTASTATNNSAITALAYQNVKLTFSN